MRVTGELRENLRQTARTAALRSAVDRPVLEFQSFPLSYLAQNPTLHSSPCVFSILPPQG